MDPLSLFASSNCGEIIMATKKKAAGKKKAAPKKKAASKKKR